MNISLLKQDTDIFWEGIGPDGVEGPLSNIEERAKELIAMLEFEDYEAFGKSLANQLEEYLKKHY